MCDAEWNNVKTKEAAVCIPYHIMEADSLQWFMLSCLAEWDWQTWLSDLILPEEWVNGFYEER